MLDNPLEIRGRHRVNNMNPEAALEAEGWGNSMIEAYTDYPARSAFIKAKPARRSRRDKITWATGRLANA